MTPMLGATTLEYALLGLFHQKPHSGYELRRVFAETPLKYFSDSPGAIYPALRRLVARGWIIASAPEGGRRRRELRLSGPGREAFIDWLRRPVTRDDVDPDTALLLRFAFMGQALPAAEIPKFIEDYSREMRAQLKALQGYYDENAATWPLTGRLAFEHGLALHETKLAWARGAARALKQPKAQP